jgi:CRP/FNR family transcriptional regulator
MELRDILKQAFPSLDGRSLALMERYCRVKEYPKNQVLFLEGERGEAFFLLVAGAVKIYKTSPSGQETVLKLLGPGTFFGEVILFEQRGYPVSAVALKDSKAVQIPRKEFMSLLDDRQFRNEFIAMLMAKQRYLTERILYLTSYDVEERFFRFLIERYGVRETYAPDISKKEIASVIGTIPETLSRLLDRLKMQGVISVNGNILQVRVDYLERFTWEEAPDRREDVS